MAISLACADNRRSRHAAVQSGFHRAPIELDVERRDPLADVVVQLAGNPLPLDFLAGNQPPRQLAIEFPGLLQFGDVAHDTEQAIGFHPQNARLVVTWLGHRQLVLEHDGLAALRRLLERLHHQVAQRRRHDVAHLAADNELGGANSCCGSRA